MIKVGDTVAITAGEYKGKMGVVAHIEFDNLHLIMKPTNILITNLYTDDVNRIAGVKLATLAEIQRDYQRLQVALESMGG